MEASEANAAWFARAKRVTPGGVNSPVRAFNGVGGTPLVVSGGKGAEVFAADGRTLTDFCCSWGRDDPGTRPSGDCRGCVGAGGEGDDVRPKVFCTVTAVIAVAA